MATDGGFSFPAVALRSGNRRTKSTPGAPETGGKLKALLTSWRPSARQKLSHPSTYTSAADGSSEQDGDFFGLGGVASAREIRTAVHYGPGADWRFSQSLSAPLRRANPSDAPTQASIDFCQLTTSPLKYVKKSRDSLLNSSDDDSSGDESRMSWRQVGVSNEHGHAKTAAAGHDERTLLARARVNASLATGKEHSQCEDGVRRRPHSAPTYPSSLSYAIEALRLSKDFTSPQPMTAPAARSVFSPSSAKSEPSHRNSVGLDSAIGLDDGRVSSPSSSASSSSSTPACQPNNPSRRSAGTVSTPTTVAPSLSTSPWASTSALSSAGKSPDNFISR